MQQLVLSLLVAGCASLAQHQQPRFASAIADSVSATQAASEVHEHQIVYKPLKSAEICSACHHADILCQPKCQNPSQTCDFYRDCAEVVLSCGPDGYPIGKGLKNCRQFEKRLSHFTFVGQAWILEVMTCLQRSLVQPLSECSMTCDRFQDAAFASHPSCYVEAGVCELPLKDWVELVLTVRTDLLTGPALKQAVTTLGKCALRYTGLLDREIGTLERKLEKRDASDIRERIALLKSVRTFASGD